MANITSTHPPSPGNELWAHAINSHGASWNQCVRSGERNQPLGNEFDYQLKSSLFLLCTFSVITNLLDSAMTVRTPEQAKQPDPLLVRERPDDSIS